MAIVTVGRAVSMECAFAKMNIPVDSMNVSLL